MIEHVKLNKDHLPYKYSDGDPHSYDYSKLLDSGIHVGEVMEEL